MNSGHGHPKPHLDRHEAVAEEPEIPRSREHRIEADDARIAALEVELSETRDRWMRAEAEIVNVRARAKRDVDDTRQFAMQTFATDVVEAAENLRRGLDSLPAAADEEPESVTRLREELRGIERNFLGLLERNGIKREDPTGSVFDPNRHQAMAEQDSVSHAPGTVLQAWTPAWTLNGRLLRPAMVVVAKAPAPQITAHTARPHHAA